MRPHLSILIWMILLSMLVTPPLWAAEEDEAACALCDPGAGGARARECCHGLGGFP